MTTDWPVWPIFIIQLLVFCTFLFSRKTRVFGIKLKTLGMGLLLLCAIGTAISLYHDSTNVLNLYF